ncbi:cation diffusion facilitator family transporter [Agromyces intestinalis]|uniref:Cation diffusion facilitator family transporter n=1 Tax=Agromyces intestinalis TaxID=2592652 RepID=A0A5C1YH37_9MICO|nr:cation diffusion facilitator family transporter [Agromyces intestinalis]QEO14409.1 cation diffusion facilitator family transporter [Agromyces intestinalis]
MTIETTKADAPSESLITVLVAFGANALIAIAKTIAAVLTGSASMVAETAHSWADTGNEVFLYVAERRSKRRADTMHPFGYGKEAYVWSMFAAFGLFTVGAVVSVWHGFSELADPEPAGDFGIAYAVLGISALLEGISFLRSVRQARRDARERHTDTLRHIVDSSNPTLRAVFFEDAAALIGLALAFSGILLHQLTGSAVFDAIGSILVGVLLGVVAILLIGRNRDFLVGVMIDPRARDAVLREVLADPRIDRVTKLHIEFIGPSSVLVIAAIDLAGDHAEHDVAAVLHDLEVGILAHDRVGAVVLTLSAPDDPALVPEP